MSLILEIKISLIKINSDFPALGAEVLKKPLMCLYCHLLLIPNFLSSLVRQLTSTQVCEILRSIKFT